MDLGELCRNVYEMHKDRVQTGLFAEKLDEKGLLIINRDIKNYEEISGGLPCRVVTFGHSSESDYSAADITYDAFARPTFTLTEQGKKAGTITLGVPGEHNVYNALAAIATAKALGIPDTAIAEGLLHFTGTDRRFEKKGELNGITIIDDYAHHPQEIAATLKAAHNYPLMMKKMKMTRMMKTRTTMKMRTKRKKN